MSDLIITLLLIRGIVQRREKYICDTNEKEMMGYKVRWILDDVVEYMPYDECLSAVEAYDDYNDGECESSEDEDSEESEEIEEDDVVGGAGDGEKKETDEEDGVVGCDGEGEKNETNDDEVVGCDGEGEKKETEGCVDETDVKVVVVDEDVFVIDHERESQQCGEVDAYHSDDDAFVIGGDGDKVKVEDS